MFKSIIAAFKSVVWGRPKWNGDPCTHPYATTRPNKDTWLEEMRREGKEL